MKKLAVAAALLGLATAAHAAPTPLAVKVFTASPQGFAVTATLVSGEKDAVLVDGMFLLSDAHRLAAGILESGKNLTTVYVTHWHPDHYMGLAVLKQAFPAARFVALPGTVQQIRDSWKAKLAQWGPVYGANLPAEAVVPEPLEGTTLTLEGQSLEVKVAQGDTKENSVVWIPSLRTAICGDIVYAGVYPWTVETTAADRKAWIEALDEIAALQPRRVVAGHKDARLGDDPSSLTFMKAYLRHYDAALAAATSSQSLQAKVKAKYPKLLLDVILKIAADGAFPAKAG